MLEVKRVFFFFVVASAYKDRDRRTHVFLERKKKRTEKGKKSAARCCGGRITDHISLTCGKKNTRCCVPWNCSFPRLGCCCCRLFPADPALDGRALWDT